MGVGEQSVTHQSLSRHYCLQPRMKDNQATKVEEDAGGEVREVSRKIATTTKNIVVDDLDNAKGALRAIGTEERQKVEHRMRDTVEGHTHPSPCYTTILSCESSLPSDAHEPRKKRPRTEEVIAEEVITKEVINEEPITEEQEVPNRGNESITIVEAVEAEGDVSMSHTAEEEGSEEAEDRQNETVEVQMAEAAAEKEARVEVREVIEVTEVNEAAGKGAAEAVKVQVTEKPKTKDNKVGTKKKQPVTRSQSPTGNQVAQIAPPCHDADKVFQGPERKTNIYTTHREHPVKRQVLQQPPGGRSLGVGDNAYKMTRMGTGMEVNRDNENKIFAEALTHTKSQSEYFCDRPKITSRMEHNTSLVKRLMVNRRDHRDETTIYDLRYHEYLAEALAEGHRNCRHILSSITAKPERLCETFRGNFYVEVGYGDTPEEKVNGATAVTAKPTAQEPSKQQNQAEKQAVKEKRDGKKDLEKAIAKERRDLVIHHQQEELVRHQKIEESKFRKELTQEQNRLKKLQTKRLQQKHEQEWEDLKKKQGDPIVQAIVQDQDNSIVQDQDNADQQDQEQEQDQEDEDEVQ